MPAFARSILMLTLLTSQTVIGAENKEVKKVESKSAVKTDAVNTEQSAVSASPATTSNIVLDNAAPKSSDKKVSASVNLTSTTDLKSTSDETKSYDGIMAFGLGYKLNSDYKLGLSTSIVKNFSNSYEETIADSSLSLGYRAIELGAGVTVAPKVVITLPTSKTSRVRDDMNGGLTLAAGFSKAINSRLTASFSPVVSAYSHKYTTNRINRVNKQYSSSEGFSLSYSVNDSLSASVGLSFAQSWSYRGTKRDDQYGTDFSLSYQIEEKSSLTAGMSTGGQIYRSQKGPDSAIEVYDPNSTSFYLTYGISL